MECVLPTFNELTDDQIKRIDKNSYQVNHKKDDLIFRQNQPISYIKYIKSGLVKIHKEGEKEKTVILKITTSDSFLGILSVFNEKKYIYSATAIEDTCIIYTSLDIFKDVVGENGKYALHLLRIVNLEAGLLVQKLINISQKQVTGRLAEVLLFFSIKIYQSNSYYLPVSRMELAELVSTTKESISRTLTEFKNDKIIEIDDKRVEIKSIELLQILSKMG